MTRQVLRREPLPAEAYTCALSPDKSALYISLWGGGRVLIYDLKKRAIAAEVGVGSHPNDMVLTKDGIHLFVANGNENTVSVVDLPARKVTETLTTSLYPDAPAGSTPNGLALLADEKTLYVANADNNCLAVFDVSDRGESRSLGFIPTGWYPTAVREVGGKIYVANGKGVTSLANPGGPQPTMTGAERAKAEYIGNLFQGNLSIIDKPDEDLLAGYTRLVYENTPYTKERETTSEGQKGNPIPREVGGPSPIKYVFYIIKENRTYDQVFGDMPEGNGDASMCLFPEKITPNHHALAREFVLLDNFYVNAEVSADGHNWSMAGYATDFVEKTWPTSYGGRGGTYDYEGTREAAHPKGGFIWDYCKRAGVSYRSYGEFVSTHGPRPNNVSLDQKNVAVNKYSIRSGELNLSVPDAIDDVEFSEIVWKAVKGLDSKMPAPRRSAFVRVRAEEEEDDD